MKKKIALIDSGISYIGKKNIKTKVETISMGFFDTEEDEIGHGTAVSSILLKNSDIEKIYSFKIFGENRETTFEDLFQTLEYISKNLKVNVIHLSMGLIYIEEKEKLRLKEMCSTLVEQGMIIVAAFDNMGAVSFPAAFENVIGVYWSKEIINIKEYIYLENSPVNILGYSGLQRLPWKEGKYKNLAGSSFVAPHITNLILNFLSEGITELKEIQEMLKKHAKAIRKMQQYDIEQFVGLHTNISKALIFPVNKEIKTLVENLDMAEFELYELSDVPYSKLIGKNLSKSFNTVKYTDKKISCIDSVDWNGDFDTVVLGHVGQISKLLHRDFILEILQLCKLYKKNLYSFDELSNYKDLVKEIENQGNFVEYIFFRSNREKRYIGALNKIAVPVVAVVGTGPKQGKYTLQLSIIRELKKLCYKVGFFGTEPSAALLGADVCFPIGYNSGIQMGDYEYTQITNQLVANIQNKDIIIIGLQSQILQYSFGNIAFYPFEQERVLIATEADCMILCVNLWDDLDYIKRCIQYIESYYASEVLCIVIYPYKKDNEWTLTNGIEVNLDNEEVEKFREIIREEFKLPVYINRKENDLVVEQIIDFF